MEDSKEIGNSVLPRPVNVLLVILFIVVILGLLDEKLWVNLGAMTVEGFDRTDLDALVSLDNKRN